MKKNIFFVLYPLLFLITSVAIELHQYNNTTISKADEGEEEPCDCGTMAPGECAPCPDLED